MDRLHDCNDLRTRANDQPHRQHRDERSSQPPHPPRSRRSPTTWRSIEQVGKQSRPTTTNIGMCKKEDGDCCATPASDQQMTQELGSSSALWTTYWGGYGRGWYWYCAAAAAAAYACHGYGYGYTGGGGGFLSSPFLSPASFLSPSFFFSSVAGPTETMAAEPTLRSLPTTSTGSASPTTVSLDSFMSTAMESMPAHARGVAAASETRIRTRTHSLRILEGGRGGPGPARGLHDTVTVEGSRAEQGRGEEYRGEWRLP
jgi:hypothetical protein